jgi:predicted DNA-binding protein with PD1-like motif
MSTEYETKAEASPPNVVSGVTQSHAVRLPSGSDLVPSMLEAARQAMANAKTESAFVMTAVGSLSDVTLRMAATDNKEDSEDMSTNPDNKKRKKELHAASLAEATSLEVRRFSKHFEIVSLVGTFSSEGGKHLHMSVSDEEGNVVGGHVMAGTVFTTLELVLGTIQTVSFARDMDVATGYKELSVKQSSN